MFTILICNEGGSRVPIGKLVYAFKPQVVLALYSEEKRRFDERFWSGLTGVLPGTQVLHLHTPPPKPDKLIDEYIRSIKTGLDSLFPDLEKLCRVVFDITTGMGLLRELQGEAAKGWAASRTIEFHHCHCGFEADSVTLLDRTFKPVTIRLPEKEEEFLRIRMGIFSGLRWKRDPGTAASPQSLTSQATQYNPDLFRLPLVLNRRKEIIDALKKVFDTCENRFLNFLKENSLHGNIQIQNSFKRTQVHLKCIITLAESSISSLDLVGVLELPKLKTETKKLHLTADVMETAFQNMDYSRKLRGFYRAQFEEVEIDIKDGHCTSNSVGIFFENWVYAQIQDRLQSSALLLRGITLSSPKGTGARTPDGILCYPNGDVRFIEVKSYIPPLSGNNEYVEHPVFGFTTNMLEVFGKYKSLDDMMGGNIKTFMIVPFTKQEILEMTGDISKWPALRRTFYEKIAERIKHMEHFQRTITLVPMDRLEECLKRPTPI